ncbi:hypothetical protein D3C80_1935470 [compost metagenome]
MIRVVIAPFFSTLTFMGAPGLVDRRAAFPVGAISIAMQAAGLPDEIQQGSCAALGD